MFERPLEKLLVGQNRNRIRTRAFVICRDLDRRKSFGDQSGRRRSFLDLGNNCESAVLSLQCCAKAAEIISLECLSI